MRLALRVIGTWLIGLALLLLVIDGTKSLAAKTYVFTSLGQSWQQFHAASMEAVFSFVSGRLFADLLGTIFTALLSYPAFAVLGVLGIIFALLGRKPRRERYLQPEYI